MKLLQYLYRVLKSAKKYEKLRLREGGKVFFPGFVSRCNYLIFNCVVDLIYGY